MDNQQSRRGHFNRSRRGPDRRGPERRTPPPQAQDHGRDHVDVEHIMRDIRSRIAKRHGIDLSNQQIQELAARRLEAILDPRAIKPALLDELRRSAGAPPPQEPAETAELTYSFEDSTLYESHRGTLRFFRRLLNPILKLFFNPNPLIQSLNIQARWNTEATRREGERVRRQTEWNALHYELVHRMVTEVSRVSLELQSLSTQVESLSAKVDFNERRVRSMEGSLHQARPSPSPRGADSSRGTDSSRSVDSSRGMDSSRAAEPAAAPIASGTPGADTAAVEAPAEGQTSDSTKRRRRRRRGRRGSGAPGEGVPGAPQQSTQQGAASDMSSESGGDDEPDDDAGQDEPEIVAAPVAEPVASTEAAPAPEAAAPIEYHTPEPVAPAPAPGERDPEA